MITAFSTAVMASFAVLPEDGGCGEGGGTVLASVDVVDCGAVIVE